MNLTHIFATGVAPNTNDMVVYRNQLASKDDGNFDGVHTSRDANGSDFVVLLSNRFVPTGLCGIAFFPTSANPAENDAYNVTEASCALGGMTFPHELGHNQCAGHDDPGANGCGYAAGLGFVDAVAGLRTVMARSSTRAARAYPCTRRTVTASTAGCTGSRPRQRGSNGDRGLRRDLRWRGELPRSRLLRQVSVAGIDGESCIFSSLEDAIDRCADRLDDLRLTRNVSGAASALDYNISRNLTSCRGRAVPPTTAARRPTWSCSSPPDRRAMPCSRSSAAPRSGSSGSRSRAATAPRERAYLVAREPRSRSTARSSATATTRRPRSAVADSAWMRRVGDDDQQRSDRQQHGRERRRCVRRRRHVHDRRHRRRRAQHGHRRRRRVRHQQRGR